MNILILNWRDVAHPKSGGAELVTMEHAKAWVRAGHKVTWLTASYPGAKKESRVEGVGFVRRWGSLTVYLYAPIYLLVNGRLFDVVVDEVHGFPFFSPLFSRTPVVVFIHEIAGEIWDYMFAFPKNIIGKTLERWYFRVYRHSLFWTDAPSTITELTERGIPADQCVAIPCPVIRPVKLTRQKEKYPTFLFVSRVVRMKGIEEIIKAFSFIKKTETSARLWIAGMGEESYVQELREMMADYGVTENVTFFGEVTEAVKYDLMARAHLLLHASVKEGWGLVVLEAASVGTPAIVYNVPGLRDVVVDGSTGIVLNANNPREMAQAALRLLHNRKEYRLLQKNAGERVKKFRWRDVTQQSLQLLERAVV